MKNKLIFGLILGIFLLVSVSATLPPVKQFDCIQIKTISNATQVNLSSITFPNETSRYLNVVMTKNAKTFNYTFCDTSQIGNYIYDYFDNEGNTYVNDFNVTPDGFINNIGLYIIILILTLGIVLLGYYVEDYWVLILGSFGLILFGLYILFYGIAGAKDTVYTWGIGIITLMLGAYFGVRASLEQLS